VREKIPYAVILLATQNHFSQQPNALHEYRKIGIDIGDIARDVARVYNERKQPSKLTDYGVAQFIFIAKEYQDESHKKISNTT